jgi:hypothetical protein
VKAFFARSMYAFLQASIESRRRPSMIAMSLYGRYYESQIQDTLRQSRATYPPVLVPPIMSNICHGSSDSRPCSLRYSFEASISCSRSTRAERPLTPPPSVHLSRSCR